MKLGFVGQRNSRKARPDVVVEYAENGTSSVEVYGDNFSSLIKLSSDELDSIGFFRLSNVKNIRERLAEKCSVVIKQKTLVEVLVTEIMSSFLATKWVAAVAKKRDEKIYWEQVHDTFTVQYSGNLGSQQEVYFLPEMFLESSYRVNIEKLINMRALFAAYELREGYLSCDQYSCLLMPLSKATILRSSVDNSLYGLWKEILNRRNLAIERRMGHGR